VHKVEKPGLHTNELGDRKDFFWGGTSGIFPVSRDRLSKLLCSIIIQRLHCSFCAMTCCHIFCLLMFVANLLYLIFAG